MSLDQIYNAALIRNHKQKLSMYVQQMDYLEYLLGRKNTAWFDEKNDSQGGPYTFSFFFLLFVYFYWLLIDRVEIKASFE